MGRPRKAIESSELTKSQTHPHYGSLTLQGVLILSLSREPLYMTSGARTLLAQLNGTTGRSSVIEPMPSAVYHVCDELQMRLLRHSSITEWPHHYVQHLAQTEQAPILLRGYGMPDQGEPQQSRLLILLEATLSKSPVHSDHAESDYRLTDRQRTIVDGLMRGLTNKELAVELRISTHTVKEYIRQIMMKVNTTTRTGIVARYAGLTLPLPPTAGTCSPGAWPHTVQVA